MNLQQNIRQYLKETGRTQSYLCRKTGISPSAMSLSLGGKRHLQISEYLALCKALHVPPQFFFDDSEASTKKGA